MGKAKFKVGLPRIKVEKGIPRFFVSEKHEKRIRWVVRGFTLFGIAISVVSFPWYISLAISIAFVAIDFFVEKILFIIHRLLYCLFQILNIKANGGWQLPLYQLGSLKILIL